MRTDSLGLVPFAGFSRNVLTISEAKGPFPTRVTPASLMLYMDDGVKFSRW